MFDATSSSSLVFDTTGPQHVVPTTMTATSHHLQFTSSSVSSPLLSPCSIPASNFVSPHCSVTSGTRSLTSSMSSTASEHSSKRNRDSSSESTLDGDFLDLSASTAMPPLYNFLVMSDKSSALQQRHDPTVHAQGSTKKNRPNTYIAPRKAAPSLLSAMGSLVTQPQSTSFARVPLRRQLSASKLDPFLSRHSHHGGTDSMMMASNDDMELEAEASRPRSMSF